MAATATVPASSAAAALADRYLSLDELVTYSGLSRRTLQKYIADPEHPLPAFRVGTRVLVKPSAFDAWVAHYAATGRRALSPRLAAGVAAAAARVRGSGG